MTAIHLQTDFSWGHRMIIAAGTAASAAAIPLLAAATVHADATSDLLGTGAEATAAASVPDFSGLADADVSSLAAAPTTIPEAITASLVPINTADADITAELANPGFSSDFEGFLNTESDFLSSQTDLVNEIGTLQEGFTHIDVADLVKLDDLMTVANTNVLNSTTDFLGTAGESMSQQFTTGLDLVGADFGAIGADLNVLGIGSTADLLSTFGIDPSFLFDGLSAGF